jgi:hypothetical protein
MNEGPPQLDIESLFTAIYFFLTGRDWAGVLDFLVAAWDFANVASLFLAPILLFGIILVSIKMNQFMKMERAEFDAEVARVGSESRESTRWRSVIDMVASDNPTEWRHAVLEADTMLDELLRERGYPGDSLGERLKGVSREGMKTLDAAWEAHKVRNEIAHAGSDFILSQREARRVIDLYRQVFQEAGVI